MNEQVNQKTATYNAITSVFKAHNISFEDGMNVSELLTADLKKEAKAILFEGFRNGTIEYKDSFGSKVGDDSELNKYCNGLLSNWPKKDKRLNGGVKYEVKNPGVRAGQGDSQVRELRKLLKQVKGTEAEAEVQTALDERIAAVKAERAPKVQINVDAIPENLKHLVK